MKLRLPVPKRKLQATATRRVTQQRVAEEEEQEPTMKFSTALVIVVILHVVAIGGVYAFTSVKAHHPAVYEDTDTSTKALVHSQSSTEGDAAARNTALVPATNAVKETPLTTVSGKTSEPAKPLDSPRKTIATVAGVKDSGQLHTVVKGENPVGIARKLGVSYDELLKLNHIDDPKKLQIGQKLRIPTKIKTASN